MRANLLINTDFIRSPVLVLLDFIAAFDTIDHVILTEPGFVLQIVYWVGLIPISLVDNVLWQLANECPVTHITCGVPQRSILGPIAFWIYVLLLRNIIHKNDISFHCCADVFIVLGGNSKIASLHNCFMVIKYQMCQNFQLNSDKTEVLILGSKQQSQWIFTGLGMLIPNVKSEIKNLGVIFNVNLDIPVIPWYLCYKNDICIIFCRYRESNLHVNITQTRLLQSIHV